MPSKNVVKKFLPHSAYHIYNRGIEKKTIFLSQKDYYVYMRYLIEYICPPEENIKGIVTRGKSRKNIVKRIRFLSERKNYVSKIKLMSYCLMPTHFHFLIEQTDPRTITSFMKALSGRYTQYFNRKYQRVGSLYQGIYRARYLPSNRDKLVVANYIHKNPQSITNELEAYPWSSLQYFASKKAPNWLYSHKVLKIYQDSPSAKSYKSYLEYLKDHPPGGWSAGDHV